MITYGWSGFGRWFGRQFAMYNTAVFCVGRNSQILVVNMIRRSGSLTELHPAAGRPNVSLLHCKTKAIRRVF